MAHRCVSCRRVLTDGARWTDGPTPIPHCGDDIECRQDAEYVSGTPRWGGVWRGN